MKTLPLSYVLENNGGRNSRRASQVDVFHFYVHITLFLRILSLHILLSEKMKQINIPLNLIKTPPLALSAATTAILIFISCNYSGGT